MRGACSKYGRQERYITRFRWGILREIDHLEGPDVDGRIILTLTFRKWDGTHGLD